MPPVNTSASSADVDNEATAELPVLDVAAYEATLHDPIAHTDTWVLPAGATLQSEAIPTLRVADLESTTDIAINEADHSGTHEMPAAPQLVKATKFPPAPTLAPAAPSAPAATRAASAAIAVPPSPPLIEELRTALASAERRIGELEQRARSADAERNAAVARATDEAAQLRQQLAQHLESMHTVRARLAVQGADQSALEDELFARADRVAALQQEFAAQRRLLDQQAAALTAALARCETLDCDGVNLRATVARRNAQIEMLEADLVARQGREAALQARLSEAMVSIDARVPDLRAEVAARDARIGTLERTLREAQATADEKNQDLQVAEESIRNLEIDVRDKTDKLEEANVTVDEWRAVIAESQRSILERDIRIRELQADLDQRITAAVDTTAQTSEEVALEGPARVLIRTDGNTDFVHVLGRRTRIGRGTDNELVLDTKHVSRYHAVLLAGPVHTSIEDLNSTNGVFVNGKRVSRQALKDGDRVTIGRTHFRYSVRD